MFYMQHKGREKAAKVVEFVAKWLNLCLSTVLWLRSVKVWCLPNDMKVPQATHLLFLCTHFSMSKYCPWQQVLAIIPDSSMPLSVLQFRQRWHCQQWEIGQYRAPSPNWPSLAVIYSKQSNPSMLLLYTRTSRKKTKKTLSDRRGFF